MFGPHHPNYGDPGMRNYDDWKLATPPRFEEDDDPEDEDDSDLDDDPDRTPLESRYDATYGTDDDKE
jgi:hypothetical protein